MVIININDKNFKIYVISGKARNGKTSLGEFIKEEYLNRMKRVIIIHFAYYIKEYSRYFFGWDGEESTKPRELLNKLGDVIRNKLGKPTFFIDRLSEDIEILSYFFDIVIVDDARLAIELDAQKAKFAKHVTLINVERNNYDNGLTAQDKKHFTEHDLENYRGFDYIIKNDGSLDDLRKEAEKIIEKEENE